MNENEAFNKWLDSDKVLKCLDGPTSEGTVELALMKSWNSACKYKEEELLVRMQVKFERINEAVVRIMGEDDE